VLNTSPQSPESQIMSSGLLALLDDVAAIAKVAAASLDDVAAQAAKAGAKAAGVVIDDAAVTPRYVVGFAANRELPIVAAIAWGSLKNKLLILLPAALALSALAPWLITPLLVLGGAFLCFEGAEKALEMLGMHHHSEEEAAGGEQSAEAMEAEKIAGAIKTDFILSAEIMAISLAAVPDNGFWMQFAVLLAVGVGITGAVYGAVALIVKADDAGLALAQEARPLSRLFRTTHAPSLGDRLLAPLSRALGRLMVLGMPVLLKLLSVIGTLAMLWVGGGIVIHGLDEFGLGWLYRNVHDVAHGAAGLIPAGQALVEWLVGAVLAGALGLLLGLAVIPLVNRVIMPLVKRAS
jgi:predicted DNA repair protein MutK